MKKSDIVIIILNWNGFEDTIHCIDSLKKSDAKQFTIVVVDNASTDNSVNKIKQKHKDVIILLSEFNDGYSSGNNIGIRWALQHKAEYICILNNDIIVSTDFLCTLSLPFKNEECVGITGPVTYYLHAPHEVNTQGGYFDFNNPYPFRSVLVSKELEINTEVDYLSGSCLFISKATLLSVGLFDEEYFMYGEDMDYCYKTKKKKHKIVVCSNSKIWHSVSKSTGGEGNYIGTYYVNRNKFLFARKNITKAKLKLWYLLTVGSISEIISFAKDKKYRKSLSALLGMFDGYMNKKGKTKILY